MKRAAHRADRCVLVISPALDDHARAVLAELHRLGARVARFDTARFPEHAALALGMSGVEPWSGALRPARGRPIDPSAVGAVWWRRPWPHRLHPSLRGPRRDGAYCAAHAAMGAFLGAADALRVNDPRADEMDDDKPRQLALAAHLGLAVPRTLVTNDPVAARAFIAERRDGETIHKNVTSARALWRATAVARASDRALLASLKHVPLLFQERVPAATDVRATFVGDEVFAAEITYPRGGHALDWRVDFRRTVVAPVKLPLTVEGRLFRLVRALGLVYAAVDLRRRPDGEHVFLEVNPSGQWLFAERATGQPITAALAALLAGVR